MATKRCATVAQQLLNKKKHMPTEKKYPSYCVCCGNKPVYLKNRYSGIRHKQSKELVKARIVFEKESMSEKKEKLVIVF